MQWGPYKLQELLLLAIYQAGAEAFFGDYCWIFGENRGERAGINRDDSKA